MKNKCAFIIIGLLLFTGQAVGEHAIDVERAAAEGNYMLALSIYDQLPKRALTPKARVAAAQSAWGLALVTQARAEFERIERMTEIDPLVRAQALLSPATLEFQEHQLDVAELFLGKFLQICEAKPCGAMQETAGLLAADIHSERGDVAKAKEILTVVIEGENSTQQAEAYFRRAKCNRKLALLDDARGDLSQIPLSDPRAAEALRLLAQILVEQGELREASIVLQRARTEYPKQFLDSWSDYVIVSEALQDKEPERWRSLQGEVAKRFPPSEPWVALLAAKTETREWQVREERNEPKE